MKRIFIEKYRESLTFAIKCLCFYVTRSLVF